MCVMGLMKMHVTHRMPSSGRQTPWSEPSRRTRLRPCRAGTAPGRNEMRSHWRVRAVRSAGRGCRSAPRACPVSEPRQPGVRPQGWGSLQLHRRDQCAHGQTAPLHSVARTPPCASSRDQHRASPRGCRACACRMLVLLTCGGTSHRGHDRAEVGAPRAGRDGHLQAGHGDPLGCGHGDHRAAGVDRRQPAPRGDRGRLSPLTPVRR